MNVKDMNFNMTLNRNILCGTSNKYIKILEKQIPMASHDNYKYSKFDEWRKEELLCGTEQPWTKVQVI